MIGLVATTLLVHAYASPAEVKQIAGGRHAIVLYLDGHMVGWGPIDNGQLGPYDEKLFLQNWVRQPIPIKLDGKVASLACGPNTSYFLMEDGHVKTFEKGPKSAEGNRVGTISSVQVQGLDEVTQIGAYGVGACALRKDGTVWAWGSNNSQMLGMPLPEPGDATQTSAIPVRIAGLEGIKAISLGSGNGLALTKEGKVMAWGWGEKGLLGNGQKLISTGTPVLVKNLSNVVAISASGYACAALKADGSVWIWGFNRYGCLGKGSVDESIAYEPEKLAGLPPIKKIGCADGGFTIALSKTGTLYAWGMSDAGQSGTGVVYQKLGRPKKVNLSGVIDFWVCSNNTFARTATSIYYWGAGYSQTKGFEKFQSSPKKLGL
ncbi:MAG: hypothetical protein BGO01_01770 [Armatimonadetes bacterium 55-13]|nr:hypothetical protein [Armatimonadota bacterium]OJU65668.1 MAG: hypothetical protein BGO01_01770 [Armatimonadetes bacterium 55-13]